MRTKRKHHAGYEQLTRALQDLQNKITTDHEIAVLLRKREECLVKMEQCNESAMIKKNFIMRRKTDVIETLETPQRHACFDET